MDVLTKWLREFLPQLPVDDAQLAEDLTLRGIAVEGIFPAACGGARFEMDITTNRVDAMNHYGVAREAAAIYDLPLPDLRESLAAPVEATLPGEGFPVRIDAPELCGRFTARVIRGVTVKPSVGKIAEYFAALGQKSISGPVDATNFGWLAMGQPTHVFDLDTLEGGVVVRRARTGERLRLLDGTERALTADDLVVADERKALGLAGVMGGWDSRVTEATKNILVEAAWFDPAAIRASSRRHGLHTDASHRFERGADFNAAPAANHLVTRLVLEQAGGTVAGPLVDVVIAEAAAKVADRAPVMLRVGEVRRLLGATLEDRLFQNTTGQPGERSGLGEAIIAQYLTALGCTLWADTGLPGEFAVALPSWRLDLEREIDLIEEIARVYGYNRFANTLPGWVGEVQDLPGKRQAAAIRSILRALGYSEAISSTFVSATEAAEFGSPSLPSSTSSPSVPDLSGAGTVAIGNPLSEEAGSLRPSLGSGMLTMLARNLSRGMDGMRLFELGTVFTGSTKEVHERMGLVLGATGGSGNSGGSGGANRPMASALHRAEDALFFSVKGTLEALLGAFAGEVRFEALELAPTAAPFASPAPSWLAPGRAARVLLGGTPVAVFGEVSAAAAATRKLRQSCILAEIDAAHLLLAPLRQPVLRELSRFQAVERDFSFLFPDRVQWEAVRGAIQSLALPALGRVEPVEIFRDPKGKTVALSSYSLLLRVHLQSAERTLTEEELTVASDRITTALGELGGTQRA